MKKVKWLLSILIFLLGIYVISVLVVPARLDRDMNKTKLLPPYKVSAKAQEVYNSLEFIADLHCDALLWSRDLKIKNESGHVDFPRMQEANMALQAFTIVTKSPSGHWKNLLATTRLLTN